MCSVLRCDSSRRSAQRFKLPEDAEKRLEWVQFVLEVNGQRLRESCWTEISICTEHFTEDCFGNTGPTGAAQLQPGAVPSLWARSAAESPRSVEPVGTTEVVWDDLETCNSPTSSSTHTLTDAVTTGCGHKEQMGLNTDLNIEKAALLNIEGKYVVNERCLLQLFHRKCPSCGCELHMEKVACGALTVFDQQCRRCEYRNEWKSQVNASVPAAELVPPQPQNAMPTDDNLSSAVFSEIDTFNDEESHPSEEGAEGDEGGVSSDGEWEPTEDFSLTEALTKESEEETEDESEDINSPVGLKINELCTDCGKLYNILKPHTCEHKIKPYACNVCGKRCVNETSLKTHSKIHNETFEIPCKYCYAPFKTKVDKVKHEQIHEDRKDPYKCPDCPQTFATSKARSVHLSNHRAPREFKCGVCEFEFKDIHHLRRHSVVHTGLKPYKCSVCQRDFNQSSHLKSHMRLHTGERPYKCRHCDKGFNHNVSLKSHVQRYHTSRSGQKKGKVNERASNTGDAQETVSKRGPDSETDNVEEEGDTEEEVQKEKKDQPKRRWRSSGRPKGRPKRNTAANSVPSGQNKDGRSNVKTSKSKVKKLKKTGSSDEESECEQSDGNMSFNSEEEEEEETKRKKGRSRKRQKNDSDSSFHPEGEKEKKMKYSSQNNGQSRRGRRKTAVI